MKSVDYWKYARGPGVRCVVAIDATRVRVPARVILFIGKINYITKGHSSLSFTRIECILTSRSGLLSLSTLTCSISLTALIPFVTRPNTVCFPSSQGQGTVEMKN